MRLPWRLGTTALVLLLTPVFGSGGSPATASSIPIDHIVVLMQENRSFDSYLGMLHRMGQPDSTPLSPRRWNPNPLHRGKRIYVFHKKRYCEVADLNHSWNGTHHEFDHGKMDGFPQANINDNDKTGRRSMGYYTKKDLPFYYWLYKTFAMGDRYFASALTQTFPNRFYLLAGTSFGHIANDFPTGATDFAQKTIFEELDAAGITWKIYYSQVPFAYVFAYVRNHAPGNVVPIQDYYQDAQNGALPQVSFVDPIFLGQAMTENDEHPPSNVQVGESFTHDVIQALMNDTADWPTSALFLTYDEHGGFSDHIVPPKAVPPDDIKPMLKPGDVKAGFNRLGIRVPAVVISPWSKPHFVSHTVHDHTSILRFIEDRFGLPALTRRDAAADPMLEFFDFSNPSFLTPPTLPAAPVDQSKQSQCTGANGTA